jgi:hypothetical protein
MIHDGATELIPSQTPLKYSRSRRVQQRRMRLGASTHPMASAAINTLNELFSLSSPTATATPTTTSVQMRQHVVDVCDRFRRESGDSSLNQDSFTCKSTCKVTCKTACNSQTFTRPNVNSNGDVDDLHTLFPHYSSHKQYDKVQRIRNDAVSLPAMAGTADLYSLLPDEVAERYRHPESLFRPPTERKAARRCMMVNMDEYTKLISRMHRLGMVHYTQTPQVVNGLFAVEKDKIKQRLIIDARPVNALFIDSPKVDLPTPDLLTHLEIPNDSLLERSTLTICITDFY